MEIPPHERNAFNVYGIERVSEDAKVDDVERVLIYPTPMKEGETLGFPYSEMFRRFANAVQQPQSVLITYGYSFADDHINRIINDALSIPSFHLVIVSWGFDGRIPEYYQRLGASQDTDKRVSFLIGNFFADWRVFVTRILPSVRDNEIENRVSRTIKELLEMQKLKKDRGSE